jgi:3-hydroxyethyl bacteriochlorophyllide a dehydrogenase
MHSPLSLMPPETGLPVHRTRAVVFEAPGRLALRDLELPEPRAGQLRVDVEWSGISTGTEKLLFNGQMPAFPGMGYPLVPGYEAVGRVAAAAPGTAFALGERVFVGGARCFGEIRGLFGGAASRLVVDAAKVVPVGLNTGSEATLLALAATAMHALRDAGRDALPDLIVGHGVLGRLLARLTLALGGTAPVVWETDPARRSGTDRYPVVDPGAYDGEPYRRIVDASGDACILDRLVPALARGGEIVLAGFYAQPLSFQFPPAFMREARIRIAAEWQPDDLRAVRQMLANGTLELADLVTHCLPASAADTAYATAFGDPHCLKMVLDWRTD